MSTTTLAPPGFAVSLEGRLVIHERTGVVAPYRGPARVSQACDSIASSIASMVRHTARQALSGLPCGVSVQAGSYDDGDGEAYGVELVMAGPAGERAAVIVWLADDVVARTVTAALECRHDVTSEQTDRLYAFADQFARRREVLRDALNVFVERRYGRLNAFAQHGVVLVNRVTGAHHDLSVIFDAVDDDGLPVTPAAGVALVTRFMEAVVEAQAPVDGSWLAREGAAVLPEGWALTAASGPVTGRGPSLEIVVTSPAGTCSTVYQILAGPDPLTAAMTAITAAAGVRFAA